MTRAGRLCAIGGALLVVGGSAALVGTALASQAEQALEPVQPEGRASRGVAAEPERPPRPRQRGDGPASRAERWWEHAREVLLDDLALGEDQLRALDAIIERQVAARKRIQRLQGELRVARQQGDEPRIADLESRLGANRSLLKDPSARFEEIRALLTEEQRPTFDMNRARLVAESQQARETRPRRRPRRARPGADAQSKTE